MKIIRPVVIPAVAAFMLFGKGCAMRNSTQSPEGIDLYVQGVDAYRKGDREKAIDRLETATDRNPDLRMAHSLLGDLYRESGQYAKALPEYQALSKLDPYGASNQYRLGLTYQLLNRLQDAVVAYLKALDLNPRDAKSSTNLGLVYMALGQMDDAVKYARRATELDPQSAAAWSNYGVVLDNVENSAEAETAYRKSLELNSSQDAILVNLGANLTRQKKSAEAINVLSQVVKRLDTAVTHKLFADALASAERYDDALWEYDIALKKNPRYYPAMNDKAQTLVTQYRKGMDLDEKKKASALELWKQSLAVNPQQPRIQATCRSGRSSASSRSRHATLPPTCPSQPSRFCTTTTISSPSISRPAWPPFPAAVNPTAWSNASLLS